MKNTMVMNDYAAIWPAWAKSIQVEDCDHVETIWGIVTLEAAKQYVEEPTSPPVIKKSLLYNLLASSDAKFVNTYSP